MNLPCRDRWTQRTTIALLLTADGWIGAWREARRDDAATGAPAITLPSANGERYGIGLTRAIDKQAGLTNESEV